MSAAGQIESALPEPEELEHDLMELARSLFPLRRSLTGDGVRETLDLISEWAPLELTEVPSGTQVFDWTVPPEWTVREAWIRDAAGRVVVDASEGSLRLLGYSVPFEGRVRGAELLEHLHSLPEHPSWIPYRTSYYDPAWGFCVTERERASIDEAAEYDVLVDTELGDGAVLLAEARAPGATWQEVVVSTYTCHPSLANDNVSGLVVTAALARHAPREGLRRTHRFLFAPSVIGTLAWLSEHEAEIGRVVAGLIVSCVGDAGPLTYKRSRRDVSDVDRAAAVVLAHEPGAGTRPFVPWGGDERQFCSPGFDLAFGSLSRSSHGTYPQYHTSADDLDLISGGQLARSLIVAARILDVLELDVTVVRVEPRGEPQLGRRGLYGSIGVGIPTDEGRLALLWVLNLADGRTSLLTVAERSGLPFTTVRRAADALLDAGLVRFADADREP